MNAVFGALLALVASVLYVTNLLLGDYALLWLPSLLLVAGLALLLRNRRDDESDQSGPEFCATCHDSGTVYTAEWNDWRRSGPIRSIRELCPACEGVLPQRQA
ncbi:hypothetical protein LWF15_26495 [Kineosporia rhizophila]|uniref:hypothetical protein n=1 Tax=Kineosporia TaxID=49184 RepID=UPI001E324902|nr:MULTISPECIES: hypothetical protein [Kineosporia]MCE0539055.1 hypothetical protein [Kineosporia rhizophila]GLY17842.1 hypothetical protein Kisp01_48560 [Kineosporia sp. NBRC 101677]